MTKHCEKHNLDYESIESGFMGIESGCPECAKEAEAQFEREELDRKALADKQANEARYLAMGIKPKYFGVTLDNFVADTPELQKGLSAIRDLTEGKIKSVILTGSWGTGKTHLSCAAVKAMGGRIIKMFAISEMIRASYVDHSRGTSLDIMNDLASVPLLAIDEIGRTKGSEAELQWLSYIIDERYSSELPTIMISNRSMKSRCKPGEEDQCFENFVGEDILSRLRESCRVIMFTGEDRRVK